MNFLATHRDTEPFNDVHFLVMDPYVIDGQQGVANAHLDRQLCFIYSLRMALIGVLLALQVKEPDCAEHELSSPGRS